MSKWEQTTIFDSHIDKKASSKNIQHFLRVKYHQAVRMAGVNLGNIQSPQISDLPKGGPIGNTQENKIVTRANARQVVAYTRQALDSCDRDSRTILEMIIADYSDEMIIGKLGWQRTQYYSKYKPKALMMFAEAYLLDELRIFRK